MQTWLLTNIWSNNNHLSQQQLHNMEVYGNKDAYGDDNQLSHNQQWCNTTNRDIAKFFTKKFQRHGNKESISSTTWLPFHASPLDY